MPSDQALQVALGSKVAEARRSAGLSQAMLAERSSIPRTALTKIETGARQLSAAELVRLTAALDVPVDWFFAPSPPNVVSRRADVAAGGHSPILDSKVDRVARDVRFLVDRQTLPSQNVVSFKMPMSLDEAEARAAEVRALLKLPTGPLTELHAKAEELGLLAFSLKLGRLGGEAAYVSLDGYGIAVVNADRDPARRRFSLAHELGHHLFGDAYEPSFALTDQNEFERLINAFAIHLLLPRSDVGKVLKALENDIRRTAIALGVRYRVSWSAVCGHLRNLKFIDSFEHENLIDHPATRLEHVELGEATGEELAGPSVPPKYARRVVTAYRRGTLSKERTVELLWGTVTETDLPDQDELPMESLRAGADFL
jgi:Zn-dependent peptidase ImmA (M78 family)/DNA-binding XRE family transcriptional regulator